jgi:hypothetical protein
VVGLGGRGNLSPVPEFGGENAESGKRGIGFAGLLRREPRDVVVESVGMEAILDDLEEIVGMEGKTS